MMIHNGDAVLLPDIMALHPHTRIVTLSPHVSR